MQHRLTIALCLVVVSPGVAARAETKPLWNGKDLAGWTQVGPGKFEIENGVLKTTGGMGRLVWNGAKVGDSVLRVVYKTEKKESNAGVFIRIPEKPSEPWMPVNKGYEVQIDDSGDEHHVTGVLYSLTKAKSRPSKPGRGLRPNEGYIGLQNHGDKDVVLFKEITLRPLGREK